MNPVAEELVVLLQHAEGVTSGPTAGGPVHGLHVLGLEHVNHGEVQQHLLADNGAVQLLQASRLLFEEQTVKRAWRGGRERRYKSLGLAWHA